jgi:His-Xaa-Ser system radical SAM maturase HxsB
MAKAVDLMFQSDSDNITMEFQGGEPSLEFDLIKYGVYRALSINEKAKKDLSIVLCTNCISLTDELLTFCKDHSILISSSLDGPKELHDKNRGKVGSYEKVIAGFQKVRQILGKDALSALMTTSVYSLNYPKEIVDEYIQQGFSGIFIRSLNPYGQAIDGTNWDKYTNDFIIFYKKALDYIISINEKGYYFREEFAAIILRKMLTPTDGGFVDLLSPSGVVNSVIVYHYDGNVYCSDESRMLSEMGDYTFMLGSVDDEYESLVYGDKVKEIANVWANECLAGCSDCAFKTYCGADPVRNYSTQHDMYGNRPHSNWCKKNKAIITYLIELIIERPQIVLPIFKKWII